MHEEFEISKIFNNERRNLCLSNPKNFKSMVIIKSCTYIFSNF